MLGVFTVGGGVSLLSGLLTRQDEYMCVRKLTCVHNTDRYFRTIK